MSSWDENYHLKELERASGKRWLPEQPKDLNALIAQLSMERRALTLVTSTMRLLALAMVISTCSIAVGIIVGFVGVFLTVGPMVAMILGGFSVLIFSGLVRFYLGWAFLPRQERRVRDVDALYRIELERTVS